jgi:hypothetical protein
VVRFANLSSRSGGRKNESGGKAPQSKESSRFSHFGLRRYTAAFFPLLITANNGGLSCGRSRQC